MRPPAACRRAQPPVGRMPRGPGAGRRWMAACILLGVVPAMAGGAADFSCAPGFVVELVHDVPLDTEGSWVRLCPGPAGTLFVSDQRGRIYRVQPGATPRETVVTPIAADVGEAQGLLFAHDALYVVVSHAERFASGLYRIPYDVATDRLGVPEKLRTLGGGGEHGPHGIALGPDGMLYIAAGYHVPYPTAAGPMGPFIGTPVRPLVPPLLDPVDPLPSDAPIRGGWIARTDPAGRDWELVCSGLQNPYDIAFDAEGEAFTADSDMEWEQGTSWYRPTRVLHACSAADFGWRPGSGKQPVAFMDTLPAVVDVGRGSPTGMTFGRGTGFPDRYRRALFVGDWTHGRIYAVHLRPQGASFTGRFEVFVARRPLAVADVKVHDDGCLYFVVGGRETRSALYRVRYEGPQDAADDPAAVDPAECRDARALRRQLEALHGGTAAPAGDTPASRVDFLWPHLRHGDRHVRHAARVAIEHVDQGLWRERALADPSTAATLEAILALVQTSLPDQPPGWVERVLERLDAIPTAGLSIDELRGLVRVLSLVVGQAGPRLQLDGKAAARLRAKLTTIEAGDVLGDGADTVELQASLGDAAAVARAVDRLRAADTQEKQVRLAMAVRQATARMPLDRLRGYLAWLNLAERNYPGGDRFRTFIGMMRQDAVGRLSPDARRACADVLDATAAPDPSLRRTTRQFVHSWQYDFLREKLAETERDRSFDAGRKAFREASCVACHRFAGEGGDVGPDLTLVGRRFDREHILASIIHPDDVVADRYARSVVVGQDGSRHEGRIVRREGQALELQPRPLDRATIRLAEADVATVVRYPRSDMPSGLVNILTQAEILDLIAYLVSEGKEDDPCFAP